MARQLTETPAATAQLKPVVTSANFAASPGEIWKVLMFYEEIGQPPPLHLRLLLPVPLGVRGRISGVGEEVRCEYERGHLLKRITRIERGELCEFDIVEQALSFGEGIRLSSGRFSLRPLPNGRTEVSVETRYRNTRSPRWFWEPLERVVCHSFHRHLLDSMRRKAASLQ